MNNWFFIIILCLTLGLAPFSPEPHIMADIRWVLGGAKGMTALNWFDLFLHGFPWLLLLRLLLINAWKLIRQLST